MEAQFTEKNPGMFWMDDFKGTAVGGYFVRNNLKQFIEKLNEHGRKVVGIKFDGSFNLEVIVEANEEEKTKIENGEYPE